MSTQAQLFKNNLKSTSLAVLILNVGDGDAIIVRFPPAHGEKKTCAIIDCYNAKKTLRL